MASSKMRGEFEHGTEAGQYVVYDDRGTMIAWFREHDVTCTYWAVRTYGAPASGARESRRQVVDAVEEILYRDGWRTEHELTKEERPFRLSPSRHMVVSICRSVADAVRSIASAVADFAMEGGGNGHEH